MSQENNSFIALRGVFVFDKSKYPSAFRAFRDNALTHVSNCAGEPNNASALADWLDIADTAIKATGNTSFIACWVDDGSAFTYGDIAPVSDMDSIDRADLHAALQRVEASSPSPA
jgi:hypothetical protein